MTSFYDVIYDFPGHFLSSHMMYDAIVFRFISKVFKMGLTPAKYIKHLFRKIRVGEGG